jgi:acetoin utilization deacetylase AcuC-like enzyme
MKVFYTPKMVAPALSGSPSPEKPALVVEGWKAANIPLDIEEPEPATVDDFALAHDRTHVEKILTLKKANGFDTFEPEIAKSVPYTTGAMLSAARWAAQNHSAAAAPCSGFHHAGWDHAAMFCTFNGLMVAACKLRQERVIQRVAILDCDQHYGNGTEDIIHTLQAESWMKHFTTRKSFSNSVTLLDKLPGFIEGFRDCDLVLYQAGADSHIEDPLGGYLTTEQLSHRDEIVFSACRNLGLPIAWNLAGGYQRDINKVVEIHVNTARACEKHFSAKPG